MYQGTTLLRERHPKTGTDIQLLSRCRSSQTVLDLLYELLMHCACAVRAGCRASQWSQQFYTYRLFFSTCSDNSGHKKRRKKKEVFSLVPSSIWNYFKEIVQPYMKILIFTHQFWLFETDRQTDKYMVWLKNNTFTLHYHSVRLHIKQHNCFHRW